MREVAQYFQDHTPQSLPVEPVQLVAKELDLCGIATITDQVPLLGANRSFAQAGLAALQKSTRPGLVALYQVAGWEQAETTTTTINYGIGPRLNAMGRLKSGMDAVRLLCTSTSERAYQLAQVLNETNVERQQLTTDLLALADVQLLASNQNENKLIITSHAEYHQGVIGLIAGKLVETYNKPAIVLNIAGDVAKASVRSVPGINIIELLRMVQDDLLEVGGHPLAAGFSIRVDKLAEVSAKLQRLALDYISDTAVLHRPVVAELPPQLVTLTTAKNLHTFAPFGQGNREPLFLLPAQEILEVQPFGRDMTHLRLTIVPTQTEEDTLKVQPLKVLWWRGVEQSTKSSGQTLQAGMVIDLAVSLEVNSWKGRESLQLVVADWQMA
jgi:single-stranded-DNA-specific exonuclease